MTPTRLLLDAEEEPATISKVKECHFWPNPTTAVLGLKLTFSSITMSMPKTKNSITAETLSFQVSWAVVVPVAVAVEATEAPVAQEVQVVSNNPHSATVISSYKSQKVQPLIASLNLSNLIASGCIPT